jgi:hypothetical protein
MEFLIRRVDDEWFDFPASQFADVLHPLSYPYQPDEGWGDYRIMVSGVAIAFSFEDPGIQVNFEGSIAPEIARGIVAEIVQNIQQRTGQIGWIVEL